ncbi:MAG: hypothetical protein FWG25_05060 [Promicromonosporaceae bacterium]|nr:hypothetical protein [Promicromonosporaceae bacterium]
MIEAPQNHNFAAFNRALKAAETVIWEALAAAQCDALTAALATSPQLTTDQALDVVTLAMSEINTALTGGELPLSLDDDPDHPLNDLDPLTEKDATP